MKQFDLMVNEDRLPYLVTSKNIDTNHNKGNAPKEVYKLLCDCFNLDKRAEEYFYMLAVDSKLNVIGVFEVSHGSINASIVHAREIFKRALLANAYGIILSHNHPSGDPHPSMEDQEITMKIKNGCELLGLALIDHIVIGENDYCSFQETHIL